MMSNLLRCGALATFLFVASAASAADPATSQHYRAKQVIGTKIMLKGDNNSVGTVDDLVFDDGGNLEYLIVDNGGKLVTVPFEAANFDIQKKVAILSVNADQYKLIPTYTTTTYPSFYTPAYRTDIYKQYDLTPRDLRVLRRR